MKFKFSKYQANGNDFIIFKNFSKEFPKKHNLIKKLCSSRFGIGADGVIFIENCKESDFKMVYYNSDGRLGSLCGNGARCSAKFAFDENIISKQTKFMAYDGLHHCKIDKNLVHLSMNDIDNIRTIGDDIVIDSGSPHYVKIVQNIKKTDVFKNGKKIRNSKFFNTLVISVILASALYAGVSSYDIPSDYIYLLEFFDYGITIFFTIEILIRIVAEKSLVKFFKDGWNVFDFIIVTISLVPVGGTESVFVARLLRIIRILRIVTVVPAFRHIIEALIKTIPRVGFIALLMFIFIYIWGAIGTLIFGELEADRWGNIGVAMLTLMQVATYDDWGAIMGDVIGVYPMSWIYFVSFIIINAVVLLNMVIGVIVDVMTIEAKQTLLASDNTEENTN